MIELRKWEVAALALAPFILLGSGAVGAWGWSAWSADTLPTPGSRVAAEVTAALKQNLRLIEIKHKQSMAYFLKMECPGPEHKKRSIYIETPEGGSFFCFGPKGTAPTSKPDKRRGAVR